MALRVLAESPLLEARRQASTASNSALKLPPVVRIPARQLLAGARRRAGNCKPSRKLLSLALLATLSVLAAGPLGCVGTVLQGSANAWVEVGSAAHPSSAAVSRTRGGSTANRRTLICAGIAWTCSSSAAGATDWELQLRRYLGTTDVTETERKLTASRSSDFELGNSGALDTGPVIEPFDWKFMMVRPTIFLLSLLALYDLSRGERGRDNFKQTIFYLGIAVLICVVAWALPQGLKLLSYSQ
mmetsp:Transcript_60317/g.153257  ORF Transcript_60317/g.153257 Transcript_60317/m.153257 type:complete len:243 (-) Transcript_60317:33-761(-)